MQYLPPPEVRISITDNLIRCLDGEHRIYTGDYTVKHIGVLTSDIEGIRNIGRNEKNIDREIIISI